MRSNISTKLNKKNYITDPELQEVHYAKNKGFSFIPSEDKWMLDQHTSDTFSLVNLHESESEYKLLYLKVITHLATSVSTRTFSSYIRSLTIVEFPANISEFKQQFIRLKVNEQRMLKAFYNHCKYLSCIELTPFADYINKTKIKIANCKFLDPEKGAYTDKENASISYAFRVTTDEFISAFSDSKQTPTPTQVHQLGILVAHQLMRGISRRPTQLVQLKWSDLRPIGTGFSKDIISPELSDADVLHLRVFKGKRGDFRGFAEKRSIRLTPQLSDLVKLYNYHYLQTFIAKLALQGISLNKDELLEIRGRLPIFPDTSLFSRPFNDKKSLFKSLSMRSKSLHKDSGTLGVLLTDFSKRYFIAHLQSERRDSATMKIGNNRIRHTILTNGARKGLNEDQLANITGVTIESVKPYVDLTNEARAEIDNLLSSNKVLNSFARIPVVELQSQTGFIQLNEFDEEVAVISEPHNCSSCSANLGKPLGCYPCQNFKPLVGANHNYYLEKAERKLALNLASNANPLATKKLTEVVIYIKATVKACEAWKYKAVGVSE